MKIKLKETIIEDRAVKTTLRHGRKPIVFVEGAIIEMSEASAMKYIVAGLADLVPEKICPTS